MSENSNSTYATNGDLTDRIGQIMTTTRQSANQFAKSAGISPASMYNIINRRNSPSKPTVEKILAQYSWINREWLVTGSGEMKKPEPARPADQTTAASAAMRSYTDSAESTPYEVSILRAQVDLMRQIIEGRDREITRMGELIELLREKLRR